MRKSIVLLTALAIVLGTSTVSFADAPTSNKYVKNINLTEALNSVEKNDSNIKILDSSIQLYDKVYQDDLSDSNSPDYDQPEINWKKQQQLNFKKSLNTLNDAKKQRDDALKAAKYDTERQYMSVLTLQDSINSIQAQIANMDKKIERDKLKVNLGQLSDTTLKQDETIKSQYLSSLNDAQSKLQSAQLTLKQHIGVDLDTDISLVPSKEEFVKFDDRDIQKRITNAVSNSYDLQSINNQISADTIELTIDNQYQMDYANQAKNLELDINNLKSKLEDTRLNKQITLWKSYYNLKNLEDAIGIDQANLEVAQLTLDSTEVQFKSGMIDSTKETDDKLALETQKTKLQQDINEYTITVQSFKNDLGEVK